VECTQQRCWEKKYEIKIATTTERLRQELGWVEPGTGTGTGKGTETGSDNLVEGLWLL